jgi:hypothetical protein
MNEIATEFPEKLLMFSPIGRRTYDMVLYADSYSYPPRTVLPVKTSSTLLQVTLQCHVSNAFFLKAPYVRLNRDGISKDLLEPARINMKIEGDQMLSDVPLDIEDSEEKRYSLGLHRAGECQFFGFPMATKDFNRKQADGLFLPNGCPVVVHVTGIPGDVHIEIGLVMAEYRGIFKAQPDIV